MRLTPGRGLGTPEPTCEAGLKHAVEFCARCGADGQGAKRVLADAQPDTQPVLIVTTNEIPGYQIIEVHGDKGEPPYVVRFEDGHTGLVYPGPDAVIVPAQRRPKRR